MHFLSSVIRRWVSSRVPYRSLVSCQAQSEEEHHHESLINHAFLFKHDRKRDFIMSFLSNLIRRGVIMRFLSNMIIRDTIQVLTCSLSNAIGEVQSHIPYGNVLVEHDQEKAIVTLPLSNMIRKIICCILSKVIKIFKHFGQIEWIKMSREKIG